jgi:myo-inositol-1(or 4)-monophosphatase
VTELLADLDLATAAARHAGAAVMAHFRTELEVHLKSPDQPLTAADLEADALLHDALAGARPDYGWLSEETADSPLRLQRSRVWIVDPIDGTRSFIAGRPEFSLSIGLAVDGAVVVGVVYNPATDELFHATRGGGAWLSRGGAAAQPLRVRRPGPRATMLASRSEIAAGHFERFPQYVVEPLGSTAYKLARVAAGQADVFLSRGPKAEWDVSAGVLLVMEAGGRATDLRGATRVYNQPDPAMRGVIAAGPELHRQAVAAVANLQE